MSVTSYTESLYYDKNHDSWRADIRFIWAGEKIRKTISAKSKSELQKKVQAYKIDVFINKNILIVDDITFADFAAGWMENRQKKVMKQSSYFTKMRTMKNLVNPYVGNRKMTEITKDDVQKVIDTLTESGRSFSSIKKAYEFINGCTRYYRVLKNIRYYPCEGVELPKVLEKEEGDYKFLTKEQRQLVEEESYKRYENGSLVYRYGPAMVLLMYTGMRFGEMVALTWNDIDFEEGTIDINKNSVYVDMDGEHRYIDGEKLKTKCSRRLLPMSQKARDALLVIKDSYGDCTGTDFVVRTKHGAHPVPGSFNKCYRSILANCGIIKHGESRGVHMLRHTFATMLFENGCELKIVSELLGHSNTKVTENIYIHTIQAQRIKAIKDLDCYCK